MIDDIFKMGDDALANLFEMSFLPIPVLSSIQNQLIRIQNITIPGITIDTYDVHYKTQMIQKPNGKINDPKEFTFDIRVDRYYLVYKAFVAWRNLIQNPKTGKVALDQPLMNNRTNITVKALNADGTSLAGFEKWTFVGCWCKGVGDIAFDYTSGDPLTLTITMGIHLIDDTIL